MLEITSAKCAKKKEKSDDDGTTPKGESDDAKFERCVKHLKHQQGGEAEGEYNAYAVCNKSVRGKEKDD